MLMLQLHTMYNVNTPLSKDGMENMKLIMKLLSHVLNDTKINMIVLCYMFILYTTKELFI